MPGKRDAVQERRGSLGERLDQPVADEHPAHRRVAGRDALGEGNDAEEIDHGAAVWTVPGERMKGGVEHRVPLCKRALELAGVGGGHLFPSPYSTGKPVSDTMLRKLLRKIGHGDITIHGFRATFKTWTQERTRFDNYVVEAALAHTSGDKVERAYARSDVLEKRRLLMEQWAQFCATPTAKTADKVVSMRSTQ